MDRLVMRRGKKSGFLSDQGSYVPVIVQVCAWGGALWVGGGRVSRVSGSAVPSFFISHSIYA